MSIVNRKWLRPVGRLPQLCQQNKLGQSKFVVNPFLPNTI